MSGPDATMTAAESAGGGEAVGMPSLRQAASGLAATLSQDATVAWEAYPATAASKVGPRCVPMMLVIIGLVAPAAR